MKAQLEINFNQSRLSISLRLDFSLDLESFESSMIQAEQCACQCTAGDQMVKLDD